MSSPYIEDRPWETCCDGRGCGSCVPDETICWVCNDAQADRTALDPAFKRVVPMCAECEASFEPCASAEMGAA